MSLNRRSFLKLAGIGGVAVVAPRLILPPARTILSPDATIFLPPAGGSWLPTAEVVARWMVAEQNRFTRTVTLNGTFPSGTLATLTSERYDAQGRAAIITLGNMLLREEAGTLVFSDVPADAGTLAVTINSNLAQPTNRGQRYVFHNSWRGDFVRNIEWRPEAVVPTWRAARPSSRALVSQRVS